MATLHIEHPITDLQTWLGAFTRFDEARRKAGVRAQSVRQPVDDDKYIYITLNSTVEEAAAYGEQLPGDEGVGLGGGLTGARRHAPPLGS